jgi:hypothetical protein
MSLLNSIYSASTSILDVSDKVIKAMGMTRTKLEDMLSHGETGSLTKQVAGSISQFPVVITNDHPIPFATLLCEMLELQYANYLTIALSNSPRVDINEINDRKYLKKYHSNLKKLESILSEDFGDSITESSIAIRLIDGVTEGIDVKPSVQRRMMNMMREGFLPPKQIEGLDWLMEAEAETIKKSDMGGRGGISLKAGNIAGTVLDTVKFIDKKVSDAKAEKTRLKEKEEDREESHVGRDFVKIYSYKKVNELQPTPVTARVFSVDANGTPSRSIEVVCGVKANLHPINKKEIISLVDGAEKGDILSSIIRFTTGEIQFFRDILPSMGSIKNYAEKMSKFHSSGSKILASLKRIKELNRTGESIKPNATLVISKAATEEIKRTSGIDLLDNDEAMDLCNKLGLITFIVSDPLGNKLHILEPDTRSDFHVMSTDTLEKQVDASQDAALTKELRKIISKGE